MPSGAGPGVGVGVAVGLARVGAVAAGAEVEAGESGADGREQPTRLIAKRLDPTHDFPLDHRIGRTCRALRAGDSPKVIRRQIAPGRRPDGAGRDFRCCPDAERELVVGFRRSRTTRRRSPGTPVFQHLQNRMLDPHSLGTRRLAPAIVEYIHRTSPAAAPVYRLTAEAADAQFEQLARELFAAQFAANPPYQAWCRSRRVDPTRIRSWRDIPAVPTAAFKEFDLTCLPPAGRTRVFHSSGTTAQRPGRNFHDAESLSVYEASLRPWFVAHVLAELPELEAEELLAPGQDPAFLSLTPPAAAVPHSSLVYMFDTIVRHHGARDSVFAGRLDAGRGWEVDHDRALFALRKSMCANRPVLLLGTAFNFVQLLDHFAAGNIRYRLAEGSRVLETGGYKGRTRVVPKAELHALITRHLGISARRIGCEYGMCELASQAYDDPGADHRRFQFPPWARVRVISPETGADVPDGQPGLIQICDLANVASVVALQTGDLGVRFGDGSFELLGRAEAVEPKGCSLNATDV